MTFPPFGGAQVEKQWKLQWVSLRLLHSFPPAAVENSHSHMTLGQPERGADGLAADAGAAVAHHLRRLDDPPAQTPQAPHNSAWRER